MWYFGPMILVADSGSTKTNWILITDNGQLRWQTIGLNPVFHTRESLLDAIAGGWQGKSAAHPDQIWFYGAGCGRAERKELVEECLAGLFPKADVHVEHDMLGASRALFGKGSGLCGILGTGSNFCVYRDGEIVENPISLGFIMGDHGSGNHIGRHLVTARLEGLMPQELWAPFDAMFPTADHATVIDRVYRQPLPNRYLASFAPFAGQHKAHPWVRELVMRCFTDFWTHQGKLCRQLSPGLPFKAVGTIAMVFQDELQQVTEAQGFVFGGVLGDPLESLVAYHTPVR
jgi:N-acetylglucosamine kinase-like BadF-type ATPase